MTDTVMIEGETINPGSFNNPDGNESQLSLGKQGELLLTECHGPWYTAAIRGLLYTANITAATIPVVASGLVSVFSIYNPASSNRVLELIDWDMGNLSGTTVIDVFGLYWTGSPLSGAGTFTTPGVFGTNYFGGAPGKGPGVGIFYSAYTHSGTPARVAVLNSQNTTTVTTGGPVHYDFNGKIVLFPGDVVSVATSTAAAHASTTDIAMRWAEWPFPA